MPIPKTIIQIWIGPLDPPVRWMKTWKKKNPDWEYRLIGNDELYGRRWRNQKLIDHYLKRCEEVGKTGEFTTALGARFTGEKATLFAWHVMADVMRYELLHETGGFMPGADTECVAPIPEDAFEGAEIYAVNTGYLYAEHLRRLNAKIATGRIDPGDMMKARRYDPLAAAPVMASAPGHEFLELAMSELDKLDPDEMGEAVDTTGNVLMARLIAGHPDKMRGFVIRPYQKEREAIVSGSWKVHHSGTTLNRYRYAR